MVKEMTIKDIIQAVNGFLLFGDPSAKVEGVSTDTRTLKSGEAFFALRGENFDGHDFVEEAFEKGAKAAVVSVERGWKKRGGKNLIKVSDTLKALGDLAKYYRSQFELPVVAVTGSVGKTTTKEMTAAVLSEKLQVLKTEENFNNEIGVPLTIFKLKPEHEAGVFELAMRGREQIRWLAQITKPLVGIITNIGISHLEFLGTQSNILKAKAELLEEMGKEGVAILNRDEWSFRELQRLAKGRVITYGMNIEAEVTAEEVNFIDAQGSRFLLRMPTGKAEVRLSMPGTHNIYNALAAAAAGFALGLEPETIKAGLGKFQPLAMRMQILTTPEGFKIIDDSYNASPASMKGALEVLKEIKGVKRRVAVLGDMLELGEVSVEAHLEVGRLVAESGVDLLLTVGNLGSLIARGAKEAGLEAKRIMVFETNVEALKELRQLKQPGDIILVKASRAMQLEEIVRGLKSVEGN